MMDRAAPRVLRKSGRHDTSSPRVIVSGCDIRSYCTAVVTCLTCTLRVPLDAPDDVIIDSLEQQVLI